MIFNWFNWFDDALSCMMVMALLLFSLFMAVFCLMHHSLFSLVTECISNILFSLIRFFLSDYGLVSCSPFVHVLFIGLIMAFSKEKKKGGQKRKETICRIGDWPCCKKSFPMYMMHIMWPMYIMHIIHIWPLDNIIKIIRFL